MQHSWASDRAKVAAESEISPPISPKQQALAGGPQGSDFIEPLQESNNDHRRQSLIWDRNTNVNNNNNLLHPRPHSYAHPNSPYGTTELEPVSPGQLLMASSSTSSLVSVTSSAASSTTTLSSVSSHSDHNTQCKGAPTPLSKLDTEKSALLSYIDTPPSSHAASPSSPSYPTLKGPAPFAPKDVIVKKQRAPYHCTKKSIPQIVREISDALDGRDKMIKVVQYFAKVFLWLFLSDPKKYKLLATRMKALAKQFSTTRKIFRLGHFIDPMATVLTTAVALRASLRHHGLRKTLDKDASETWRNTVRDRLGNLNNALGFCQDIVDDIYCLGVIGVLDRSFTDKAEPWSNALWMVGVTIDLHENIQSIRDVKRQIRALEAKGPCASEEEMKARSAQHTKLTTKLHWLKVTTVKLGGDFMFCAYDNLHCSFSDGFQAVTGLASGLAGAYKFVGKVMES
ncbi:hypothetical protein BGX31_008970 [Mortierella sp. GBA43]|nr:hypothetical protein BGX31_008970 [Mortierella sp. GBA43]